MDTNTLLIFAILLVAAVLFFLSYSRGKELTDIKLKEEALREELNAVQSKLNDSYRTIPVMASQQFDEFKKNEIEILRAILAESAKESALAEIEA